MIYVWLKRRSVPNYPGWGTTPLVILLETGSRWTPQSLWVAWWRRCYSACPGPPCQLASVALIPTSFPRLPSTSDRILSSSTLTELSVRETKSAWMAPNWLQVAVLFLKNSFGYGLHVGHTSRLYSKAWLRILARISHDVKGQVSGGKSNVCYNDDNQ